MLKFLVISGISYWAIGWGLAFGPNSNSKLAPFIGGSEFMLAGTKNYANFFIQFVFAATSSTIVAGAVAERVEFITYISYSILISGRSRYRARV